MVPPRRGSEAGKDAQEVRGRGFHTGASEASRSTSWQSGERGSRAICISAAFQEEMVDQRQCCCVLGQGSGENENYTEHSHSSGCLWELADKQG